MTNVTAITSRKIFKKHYYVRIFKESTNGIPKFIDIELKNRKEQMKLFNYFNGDDVNA